MGIALIIKNFENAVTLTRGGCFFIPNNTPFCYLETAKVLKFPKIFGGFVEKMYLCTLFVRRKPQS
jgi:hypothetical protein